jgi:deoxycytidylate deaminase
MEPGEGRMRPSWDDVFMGMAEMLAQRSTCARLHVGSVVVTDDNHRILSMGYNGNYTNGPNECDSEEPGNCGCFPINVKVQTSKGAKRIQNVRKGDFVLTHLNRLRKVTNVLRQDRAIRRFVKMTVLGGQRFVSTADHPVMIETSFGPEWRRADELSVGDVVLHTVHPCASCSKSIASHRKLCTECFKKSSKGAEFIREASERMKRQNPMSSLYGPRTVVNNERVSSLVERQKLGNKHLEEKLFEFAQKFKDDMEWGAVVVDHTRVIPDLVLVNWDEKKIIAFEYEKKRRHVRPEKYDACKQYDDVIWHVEQKFDDFPERNGFACLPIKTHEVFEQDCKIFNLEVEEDNSFVCQNIVVHNCIHSEENCLVKSSYSDPSRKKMYVTVSPCVRCAKLIVNAKIDEVIYRDAYRIRDGLEILVSGGVIVRQYAPRQGNP